MGLFADTIRGLAQSAPGDPTEGEFVKGMRSGGNAAMASLNNLAGAVGQKVGAQDFAAGRFSAADQYTADAAAAAPRVTSMRDIHGVGDAFDYAKGLAGGMVPVGAAALGATLLTGGGAVPAIAAGTAATAPFEVGDIVGRMRERGQPIDLTRAAVGGVGSAALQNVLPGVARARLGGTAGRLPGGALATIPEQALLAGGSEVGKQYAATPEAPLDWAQAGEAAAGGAVMGVPIAGMHALGDNRAAIGAAANKVGGAVKSATERVTQATGDAAKTVGEKATADEAGKTVKGMEIPDTLNALYDDAKAKGREVLDKIAKSDDVIGDFTKFAGLQGEKLKQALAGDDGERLQHVESYVKELGDQHPAVRDWLMDKGNHAKQAAVAVAKQARDAAVTAREHLTKFADAAEQRLHERKFKRTDGSKLDADTVVDAAAPAAPIPTSRRLKSEDDSGIRKALGDKLIPELLKARPELAELINDPKQARQIVHDLHRGFAPLIEDLANGKQPSSDAVARLIDLAGPAADKLIEAAHSVVGDTTNVAKTREFFSGLNQFTKVRDSSDTLVQTMRKSLNKGLERSTSDADLRQEAALLQRWRDDKRPVDGPNADPVAQRLHYQVQKHLDARYGKNAEAVLAALEKAKPKEQNQIERARVKYDEDGQPIDQGVDDGFSDSGSPGGRMQFFGGGRKGTDLLPHPDDDPGKKDYPGAAVQKMNKIKALHPDSTPRFITATEMGLDHQWVKDKYKALVKMGNESGVDGERFAREQLDRYGVIATERALQDTHLSFDELDAMKLDRKRYADSKSRVDAGDDVVLDAVKVVRSMSERFKDEYTPEDNAGRMARLGRMFIEGIAAAQDYLGRSFDIPDSVVLGKLDGREVTWGQIKKLDTRTAEDKLNDRGTKMLTELRRQFMKTEDKALRAEIAKEAAEIAGPREAAKNRELSREDSRMQQDDALDFEGDVERGINLDKRPLREAVRAVQKQIEAVGKLLDGEVAFGQGPEEVKLRKQLSQLNSQLDALRARQERATPGESLGSGQREIDPFGQIHQAAGYSTRREPEPINRDRTQQAPSLLGPRREKPTERKSTAPADDGPPLSAYDDEVPYRDGSVEQVSQDAVDRVAERRNWIANALKDDIATFKARTVSFDAGRLEAMIETMEGMDRPSSVPAGRWRTAIDDVRSRLEQIDEGEPQSPKAVAAKKAALLERARSGDESLIKEIGQHTDAVGLQNAVVHLARNGDVHEPNTARAIDAMNARIGELVKSDPQQAYDMLKADRSGKKYSLEQIKRKPVTQDAEALDLMAKMGWHFDELSLERFSTRSRETAWRAMLNEALTIKDVRDASRLNDGTWDGKGKALSHLNSILNDRFGDTVGELKRRMEGMPREMDLAAEHFGPMEDTRTAGEKARDRMANRSRTMQIAARTDEILEGMARDNAEGEIWQDRAEADLEDGVYDETNLERDRAYHYERELKKLRAERERARKEAPGWEQHTYDADNDYSFSMEGVDPNHQGPVNRKEVREYIKRTLGNSVQLAWERLGHAGEFERITPTNGPIEDIIRLSVHALNPLSTAHHESLHAFMQKLSDMKHGRIMDVLHRAGESAPILNQVRAWMQERGMGEKALAQLKDPDERAAYMYQAWADGKLKVGDETKTVLGKIADFIRSVLGIWSNDERALHIMEYFHRGDFARDMGNRDKVYNELMAPGRNRAIETARKMTQPILALGENLATAGHQRLRDTGIPALRELADAMKLRTVGEGDDPGFLPAARSERTRVMNKLAADLKDISPESINAAMESLQQKSHAPIRALADQRQRSDAIRAKDTVRRLLDDMYGYMTAAGVKVNDLGVGKDYFPRLYDTSYISSHQQEFKNVLARHGVKNPEQTLAKIMTTEGAEFTTEVDKPGMQHLKPRDLAHIPDAELAPFMRKDMNMILNGYVTQATRRAEWARRFGDKGERITELMVEARRQGATTDDLDSAQKYVRAIDGTLGDTINPEARRLFGNLIVYQNVRLLPLMIFSSIVDPMGIAVRGGTMGDAFRAFKRGVSEIPKNFKKNPQDDYATKFAAEIGVIDDTTLVHTLGALYSQGMVGDTGRKINDTLFRYNLAEQFNTSMRVSATEAAMGFLARHAAGDASPHSRRWLSELGLQPGELKFDANGRVKVTEADGLTAAESIRVKAAVNRWVDGAVLRPDAADKPLWMSDPHFALIAHLKQFTYSFHETILKRVAHEYQNGNYTPAMALASYVPIMIAADMAKGMIQGGGEEPSWKRDWGVTDYVASGVERAGLLGVGQFGVDMLRDAVRGGTGVGALVGPTIEQLAEAARVMGGRESFGQFALKSMPANALYAGALGGEPTDPKFVD